MRPDPPPLAARLRGVAGSPVRDILALTQQPGVISFAGGLPAPELFDADGLRAAFATALAGGAAGRSLQYSATEGDPALRAAVAGRLGARGLPTDPGELLITSGSQQALTLVAAVLLEPGDAVLVEEPSYLAALQCFQLAGARLVGVPCDEDGLIPGALDELVRRERPKLLYTVPTFHNPTGRTLPEARRRELARAVGRLGLWLVEDDPYGELRYRGAALPPVAALPGAEDRTIALSTLSKVLAPGLRIGWLRAPAALHRSLTVAKQAADLHSSTIDQAAAAIWLASHDLDAHVAGLCAAYAPRRDAMVDGLAATLPEGSSWSRPDGGMFVWVRLPEGWDADELLTAALGRDVAFVPGWPFFAAAPHAAGAHEPDRRTMRLSFTTHTPAEIGTGLARLAAAVADARSCADGAPGGHRRGRRASRPPGAAADDPAAAGALGRRAGGRA